jgi:hypothetical protein
MGIASTYEGTWWMHSMLITGFGCSRDGQIVGPGARCSVASASPESLTPAEDARMGQPLEDS